MRPHPYWTLAVLCASILTVLADTGEPPRAETVYQTPDAFLESAFGGTVPEPQVLWLRGGMRGNVRKILGHPYGGIRVRYWARGERSVWILEEIGKYKPITTGFVIDGGAIERVKVLVYRESHGWEVRHAFFTDQFKDARLTADRGLSASVDNISGATLSVNALTRLARLALYFDSRRPRNGG